MNSGNFFFAQNDVLIYLLFLRQLTVQIVSDSLKKRLKISKEEEEEEKKIQYSLFIKSLFKLY